MQLSDCLRLWWVLPPWMIWLLLLASSPEGLFGILMRCWYMCCVSRNILAFDNGPTWFPLPPEMRSETLSLTHSITFSLPEESLLLFGHIEWSFLVELVARLCGQSNQFMFVESHCNRHRFLYFLRTERPFACAAEFICSRPLKVGHPFPPP